MKKRIYNGLIVLFGLFMIVMIFGKGAGAILDERVGNRLKTAAARQGLAVRYDHVSFVSLTGITITGLEFSVPGARPLVSIAAATVSINPISYLAGRPSVTSCDASEVSIHLRQDADGEWEIEKIRRPPRKEGGGAASLVWPFSLSVDDLSIEVDRAGDTAVQNVAAAEIVVDLPGKSLLLDAEKADGRLHAEIRKDSDLKVAFNATSFAFDLLRPFMGSFIDFSTARLSAAGELVMLSPIMDRHIAGDATLRASGTLDGIAIQHPLLSRSAADGISFGFGFDLFLRNETILMRSAHVSVGGETVMLAGTIARPTHRPIVNLAARFDRLDLGHAVSSLPLSLRPRLPDLAVRGTLDGEFTLFLDASRPRSLDYRFNGNVESFAIISLGPEVDVKSCSGTFTHRVVTKEGETRAIVVGSSNPGFVPISAIPRALIGAVLTAEDGSFYSHKGFSPRHIHEALIANLEAGRVVRGASTLSMQLAKNLFLSRERTFSRKVEEAFVTFALEQELGKRRLLEIYLNIIEWGPGVYGIGPAARYYFGKSATELGPIESAFLASIIARPNHGWGVRPLERIGEGWWFYLRIILCKMYRRGDVTLDTLKEAGVSDTEIIRLVEADTAAEERPYLPPSGMKLGNPY